MIVKLVHAMIHFVNPSQLLPKLLDHPLFHGGTYAEFQDLIDGILNGYSYDEVLLSKLLSCIHGEIHESSARLRHLSSRGYQTNAQECSLCGQSLCSTKERAAIVFDCSHTYHSECLRHRNSFFINRHSVQEWLCAICEKKELAKKPAGKASKILHVKAEPKQEEEQSAPAASLSGQSKFEALEELDHIGSKNTIPWKHNRQATSVFSSSLNLAPPRLWPLFENSFFTLWYVRTS